MIKVGFDIGGTYIKSALIQPDGTLKDYQKVETPTNENNAIIHVLKSRLQEIMRHYPEESIHVGISTAGAVNRHKKMIAYANDNILNYTGTDFELHLKEFAESIKVYNDVDAALLGELTHHNNRQKNIFCLTLGTGIGGSYYHKDYGLVTGHRHRPHQIGYLLYHPETNTNYEQRASTNGLKKMLKHNGYPHSDIPTLFDEAAEGHTEAQRYLEAWGCEVARGIAEVQIMYDPEVIIIGGGISKQGEHLLQYIEPCISKYLPRDYGHAVIQCATFHNHAALIGATSEL